MSTSRFVGVVQQWRSAEPFEVFWVCEDFEPGGRQIEPGGRQGVVKWCWDCRSVLLWILCDANISGREKQREVWECAKVSKADQLVHGYHKRFTFQMYMIIISSAKQTMSNAKPIWAKQTRHHDVQRKPIWWCQECLIWKPTSWYIVTSPQGMFYWTATSAPKWPTSDSHKRWQQ